MWLATAALALAAAPPPLPPDARFALALYCNPTCGEDVFTALDGGLQDIVAKSGFPQEAGRPMRIMGAAGPEFGIPDADFVATYGVGVDRPDALAKSEQVLLAWFASPRQESKETLAAAHAAFLKAAELSGGWVEDLDTQRLYGKDAWAAVKPGAKLEDWFVVDAAPQDPEKPDGNLRLVTRGLRRFGDFELVVEDVAPDVAGDVSFVINAVASSAHGRSAVPGVLHVATDTVKGIASFQTTRAREGDPEEPLLKLNFEGDITTPMAVDDDAADALPAGEPTASTAPVAPQPLEPPVAGSPPPVPGLPSATLPDAPPTTLEEAQRQALARFDGPVRDAFRAGLPAGSAVAVKVPFRTSTGTSEFMWVELRGWDGDTLTGVLMNEPYDVPDLKKGQTVTVKRADVFDYVWKRADGTREGNTTAKFVK